MEVNIKAFDRKIVEKDRRYISRAYAGQPEYHWSLYSAWWDPKGGENARLVARKIGGTVRTFNPITGDVR